MDLNFLLRKQNSAHEGKQGMLKSLPSVLLLTSSVYGQGIRIFSHDSSFNDQLVKLGLVEQILLMIVVKFCK